MAPFLTKPAAIYTLAIRLSSTPGGGVTVHTILPMPRLPPVTRTTLFETLKRSPISKLAIVAGGTAEVEESEYNSNR